MDWVKRYGCVVCKTAEITEQITEHPYRGDVPDVSNCDLSSYSDHIAVGGELFLNRPHLDWDYEYFSTPKTKKKTEKLTPGGVCDPCLKNKVIIALEKNNFIKFATEEDLPPRKY